MLSDLWFYKNHQEGPWVLLKVKIKWLPESGLFPHLGKELGHPFKALILETRGLWKARRKAEALIKENIGCTRGRSVLTSPRKQTQFNLNRKRCAGSLKGNVTWVNGLQISLDLGMKTMWLYMSFSPTLNSSFIYFGFILSRVFAERNKKQPPPDGLSCLSR